MSSLFKSRQEVRSIVDAESYLNDCIQVIYGPDDTDTTVHKLLQSLCKYYGGKRANIFVCNEERGEYDEIYEWCKAGTTGQINSFQGISESVLIRFTKSLREGKSVYFEDLSRAFPRTDLLFQIYDASETDSIMAAPLLDKGKFAGFLSVENPRRNESSLFLINSVSAFVYAEITRSQHLEELRRLSYSDELTNAGNRHAYFNRIEEIKKMDCPIGIAFIDVNNLKKANDNLGHHHGDELLLSVYRIISEEFPEEVYRVGGDEFIILATGIDEVVFEERMRRIKKKWTGDISASCGWVWSADCEDVTSLINEADHRMYIQKEKFRLSL